MKSMLFVFVSSQTSSHFHVLFPQFVASDTLYLKSQYGFVKMMNVFSYFYSSLISSQIVIYFLARFLCILFIASSASLGSIGTCLDMLLFHLFYLCSFSALTLIFVSCDLSLLLQCRNYLVMALQPPHKVIVIGSLL